MSDLQRWDWNLDCGGFEADNKGDYVRYDEAATALREQAKRIAKLEAENERLKSEFGQIASYCESHWEGAGLPLEAGWMLDRLTSFTDNLCELEDENERLRQQLINRSCQACSGHGVVNRGYDRWIPCEACNGKGL